MAAKPAETIHYTTADTTAGRLLIAMSDRGVVWAGFSDPRDDAEALTALAKRFPRAELEIAGDEHASWVAAVVRHAETPRKPGRRPPLDLRGTEFQHEVWDALLKIPPGATMTYGEVAALIGRPNAYRAVAQACKANPVGVVVPCHRVIGADGSMTGYAGLAGVDRKARLLARERPEGERRR